MGEQGAEPKAASSSPCVWSEHTAPAPVHLSCFCDSDSNKKFHTWPEHIFHDLASAETFEEHQSHRDRGILHNHKE